ncbi:DUF1772-domain-containing protein [Hypomontagnella submonticulosa]|nr:DUF1772-domain-containing protein [Hypomontagnella submonticulosa]
MSTPLPPSIRVLQASSIAVLTTTAGLSASLSVFVIPRLMESPTPLLVGQFMRAVTTAHRTLPIPLLAPGLVHAWLAYRLPEKARAYALAAALTFSTLPWTRAVMMPLNRAMERRIMEPNAGPETAHQLADSWATRNLYRPLVAFAAGCIGLYAALT